MIKFSRLTLENGLRILVHEDKSTPLVTMNILYDVGSRDEDPEMTGFAHLFEHLMFGGSVNIPDYDKVLQMVGADNNAFTNNDITNYYLTVPAENIETAFWLESDRMLELDFSQKNLDVQRSVVSEEFKQRYLNQPYGDAILLIRPLAYKIHPYRWATIGRDIAHIEKAGLEEVKNFFFSHYGPNNAILVLSGNINEEAAFSMARKWFGPIERRKIPARNIPVEPVQTEERRMVVERDVPADALYKVWHIDSRLSSDFHTLDLITDLLAGGESGRLHNRLVRDKKLFSEVNAYITSDIDPGLVIMHGNVMQDADIRVAEEAVNEVIASLSDLKVSDDYEIDKVKNRFEASTVLSNTNNLNKAINQKNQVMNNLERVQPPVHPLGMPAVPEVQEIKLQNGVPAFLIESGTEDIIRMEFSFGAGQVKESMPLMASTANMMLMEGSASHTSEELHSMLEYYGAFLHMISEKDRAGLIVFFLNRHIEKIIELCHEILFQPAFPEPELTALMDKRLQWFRINREKVQNLAVDQYFESVFGPNHPYGHKPVEADFSRLSSGLLREFHSKYYIPASLGIILSGRIPPQTPVLLNRYFGSMDSSQSLKEGCGDVIKGELRRKVLVEKSGTIQTAIRIGSRTINKRHPDYPALKVVDAILGGYFGSRLMRNIREEKGYTYGVRSNVTSLDLSGYKYITTEVGRENCSQALEEIYREIRILQNEPVPDDELAIVRSYMHGEMLRMFDGPFAVAESFKSVWEFGLSNEYYYRFLNKINTIEQDEIREIANTYYNIDDLYEITAGSK